MLALRTQKLLINLVLILYFSLCKKQKIVNEFELTTDRSLCRGSTNHVCYFMFDPPSRALKKKLDSDKQGFSCFVPTFGALFSKTPNTVFLEIKSLLLKQKNELRSLIRPIIHVFFVF